MPDAAPDTPPRLDQARHEFVRLWGEMATHWGINRTMAQIHALLYTSEDALDTDEIMERLQVSRGNANMNLRSLVEWGLVSKVHQLGSRKDFYVAEKDVWKIAATIIEERQRREIQPVQDALDDVTRQFAQEEGLSGEERVFAERIGKLTELMHTFEDVTGALLPFLQERNRTKIQRLTQLASTLRRGKKGAPTGSAEQPD
jgi:DNA-binding transcriptional regulator GbsR (MarR family)